MHVDQGVTLAYARAELTGQASVVDQLRMLVADELRGMSRADAQQMLTEKGVKWFEKDGALIGGFLVFHFDGEQLVDVRSIYSEGQ